MVKKRGYWLVSIMLGLFSVCMVIVAGQWFPQLTTGLFILAGALILGVIVLLAVERRKE